MFAPDNLEIIGFNGAPLVPCGSALPVARRKSDGRYALLAIYAGPPAANWYGEEEALNYARSGHWTAFRAPLPIPAECIEESRVLQPMVLFADDDVRGEVGRSPRPSVPFGEHLPWRDLLDVPGGFRATCGPERTIESVLNDWADRLSDRFRQLYTRRASVGEQRRVAFMALCAANDPIHRWWSFVQNAILQSAERRNQTFRQFVEREFSESTSDRFHEHVEDLRMRLQLEMRLPYLVPVQKVRDLAAETPRYEGQMRA